MGPQEGLAPGSGSWAWSGLLLTPQEPRADMTLQDPVPHWRGGDQTCPTTPLPVPRGPVRALGPPGLWVLVRGPRGSFTGPHTQGQSGWVKVAQLVLASSRLPFLAAHFFPACRGLSPQGPGSLRGSGGGMGTAVGWSARVSAQLPRACECRHLCVSVFVNVSVYVSVCVCEYMCLSICIYVIGLCL